jgi:hypothetical protein
MSSDATLKLESLSPEVQAAIKAATDPEQIRQLVIGEAQKQADAAQATVDAAAQKIEADKAAVAQAAADAAAAQTADSLKRTVNIAGRDFEFEASSELELERVINNAYQVAYAVQPEPIRQVEIVDPVADAARQQAAADAEVARRADVELKFKRGEITAAQYIEETGAMADYLSKQGISIDALKSTVEHNQSNQFEKSWEQATTEFLNSPSGRDWPGGERNKYMIGLQLAALGLTEAEDKVAALAQAYQVMKQSQLIFKDETVDASADAIAQATAAKAAADKAAAEALIAAQRAGGAGAGAAAAAAAEAAARVVAAQRTSSSMFGASSGVGDGVGRAERSIAPALQIPKDASPQEILELWKQQTAASGKDLNAAFSETFAARKM